MADFIIDSNNAEINIETTGTPAYKPVDISNLSGPDLEKYIMQAFEEQGWDCKASSERIVISEGKYFAPDITLMKNGEILGFVECYITRNSASILSKKQEQIMFILEQYRPQIFILTNGISFETYFDCKYAGTMTVPISYHTYSQKNRLMKYYEMISKMMEKKDGKDLK